MTGGGRTNVAALISGGKDSMLAAHEVAESNDLVLLIGVVPKLSDSFMFHSVNLEMLDPVAECMDLPMEKVLVSGKEEVEVEELTEQLKHIVREYGVEGISIGGIESEYQRKRFEKIFNRCGVKMLAPLWRRDPVELLKKISMEFEAIIVGVSAMGMDESYLGRRIDGELIRDLIRLNERYGIHIAGEGGEYETLVLDAPLYIKRISLKKFEKVWDGMSGKLIVTDFEIVEKHYFEKLETN